MSKRNKKSEQSEIVTEMAVIANPAEEFEPITDETVIEELSEQDLADLATDTVAEVAEELVSEPEEIVEPVSVEPAAEAEPVAEPTEDPAPVEEPASNS